MNIFILGASGFIGRNMAEYFISKGHNVIGTYKTRSKQEISGLKKWYYADLTLKESVENLFSLVNENFNGQIDVVIQTAATTSGAKDTFTKPWYHVTDNAVMNSLVLREELNYKIGHHIFFSCTVMYSGMIGYVTEEMPIAKIQKEYFGVGWTKIYLEKMCEFYSNITDTMFTVIRHSNIYGPYDKYGLENSHFFGATITKVLTAKEGDNIIVWGSGQEHRNFLYIDDLCNFTDLAIENKFPASRNKFDSVNVGSKIEYSINDIVNKIVTISGKKLRILNDMNGFSLPIDFYLDISKARRYFGWEQKINIEEGIKKTIEWYKSNYETK